MLDELVSKATIEFPKPIGLKEAKALFAYMVKQSGAILDIGYTVEESRRISANDSAIGDWVLSRKASGTISERIPPFGHDSFRLENEGAQFSALKFVTIPGYSLEEHSEHTRKFWDRVRAYVDGYFASNI